MNKSYDYIMGGSKFSNLFDFISGIIICILFSFCLSELIFSFDFKIYPKKIIFFIGSLIVLLFIFYCFLSQRRYRLLEQKLVYGVRKKNILYKDINTLIFTLSTTPRGIYNIGLTEPYFYTKKNWSIEWMCRQLEISRAAYYKWLHREIPYEELENIRLAELIKEYDERFCHILGYRRMTSWINHFNHTSYSKNRVHRIMKKLGIHSVIRKKKKKYIYAKPDETAENILQRDFYATVPNQKWATDVTEFKVPGEKKKLYLSAIIDLYDRYPVAYVVSARNDNRLIFKTFDKAIAANPDAKPIFHSDRGFQYTSKTFKKKLENQEMEQSMSRVGHCIDNGPIEGFWGIIKSEMYQMYEIIDEVSLRYAIKDYLRFYSEERPQDRYGCKTPSEVRQEALSSDVPTEYPIPENKRISKYKEKWCA